ncbi:guanylate-binding protein 4-like [Actinia tenebrosa]|uniref:Guanylate-binding protein 4-like n=1 Tax=Actinia tenebrosa TaxID=6105 RepID=A0A6P8ITM0_ACTTE|nr:guanylate-binding protein 4-like [Actinia tenebrosa]
MAKYALPYWRILSAIPLVLPNDYTWEERTETCRKKLRSIKRTGLAVVPKALEQLRKIKGPVCVVSIAGPCRKGKSYVLSKAFDQGEVFSLGHSMTPETMGIWMWIVPQKFKDRKGRDFTLVLLDSEGSDSPNAKQEEDYGIFTLSVLLSSILIYNSVGVANRSDLENLDFVTKLTQRIQLNASKKKNVFPNFIWLLRDVVLTLPPGCNTIRDYLLKNVLSTKGKAGSSEKAIHAADSILNLFSGFDAFSLPPPSFNPEVGAQCEEVHVQRKRTSICLSKRKTGSVQFSSVQSHLSAFSSIPSLALATLVELYVKALNTSGVVPNVENAWDSFVRNKCTEVLAAAVNIYQQDMTSRLKDRIPCEDDVISKAHKKAVDVCLVTFRTETSALSRKNIDKYTQQFREKTNPILSKWTKQNTCETEKYCTELFKHLKQSLLDPVLQRLQGPEGFKMQISDIVSAYNKIEKSYEAKARGAKDVQTTMLMNFLPELDNEMELNIAILQSMKDKNESLERQRADREAERRRAEELITRLETEKKNRERQVINECPKHCS